MGKLAIFKDQSEIVAKEGKGLSKLSKTLASGNSVRRIQANTNGTFKRIVNGDVIGKPLRGELNVIIVNALPSISRTFYKAAYNPDAKPTLPDCWSNLGDAPESTAGNKQSSRCADCPQNVAGSGFEGKGRACRYNRRIAVVVEGDTTGDIYQMGIPAKSLFGKGTGNIHPFESYIRFLTANGVSVDGVVTTIAFNDNAETMELQFSPVRQTTEEEDVLVAAAQDKPEADSYVRLTAAQADGVTKQPPEAKAPVVAEEVEEAEEVEDAEDEVKQPKKRGKKAVKDAAVETQELADVVSQWADD